MSNNSTEHASIRAQPYFIVCMRLRMYAYVNVYSFTQAIRSRVECLCWLETTLFDIKYIYKHLTLRIINESTESSEKKKQTNFQTTAE